MEQREKKGASARKWLKVGAWVFGLAMFFFIGLFAFTQWLEHKLETSVADQSKGVYKLKLYGFETSPFIGGVSVDSLSLVPDFKRWKTLSAKDTSISRTLFDLHAKEIELRNLNFFKMIFRKNVDLGKLEVENPKMVFTRMKVDTTTSHKPLHESIGDFLKNMHIGAIDVRNGSMRYTDSVNTGKTFFEARNFDLNLDDYRLDSTSFHDPERAYYSRNIILNVKGLLYQFPDSYYRATSDSLDINIGQGTLLLTKLNIKPTIGPKALARSKNQATAYTNIQVPRVEMRGFDFPAHSLKNNILIKFVQLTNPQLTTYKDKKNFDVKGKSPMPHDLAQSINNGFDIDTLKITKGYGRYEELAEKAAERGRIHFTNFNSTMYNVCNMKGRTSRKNPTVIQANMLVMGKARLKATIRMPLLSKSGFHTIKGSVGSGNPSILNPILEPTSFVRIDKGRIRSASFEATLNRNNAQGNMRLIYSNLEMEILSPGKEGKQSFGKKILSKVANAFIIKSSNPDDPGEKARIAKIQVRRDPQRSILSYWKDCLGSGFMNSVGLNKQADKQFVSRTES